MGLLVAFAAGNLYCGAVGSHIPEEGKLLAVLYLKRIDRFCFELQKLTGHPRANFEMRLVEVGECIRIELCERSLRFM